ncbi:unnamed protein product [Musa acuminata subsp. malaccensis]|uniref:(wild Malaysian banana) hypothetical protein n=1 Tax=Musa acuminata subsp. malaccensis TaxID=214687 RepID=A0A804JL66_MUSAM|nr:unnamed protein product [Musa acuminata subsp. malaccensis]
MAWDLTFTNIMGSDKHQVVAFCFDSDLFMLELVE